MNMKPISAQHFHFKSDIYFPSGRLYVNEHLNLYELKPIRSLRVFEVGQK